MGWKLKVLGKSTLEAEAVPMVISLAILGYLLYPGVREAFYESESSRAA